MLPINRNETKLALSLQAGRNLSSIADRHVQLEHPFQQQVVQLEHFRINDIGVVRGIAVQKLLHHVQPVSKVYIRTGAHGRYEVIVLNGRRREGATLDGPAGFGADGALAGVGGFVVGLGLPPGRSVGDEDLFALGDWADYGELVSAPVDDESGVWIAGMV